MNYLLTAAAAAIFSAGAAQAAVYQYDVKMQLTNLTLDHVAATIDGAPHPALENAECEPWGDGTQYCAGSVDFTKGRRGLDFLREYKNVISGSFTLDSEYDDGYQDRGSAPECSGSSFLCSVLRYDPIALASSEGFSLQPASTWFNWHVDDGGLSYFADAASAYSFQLGNTTYGGTMHNDIIVEYRTTKMEITEIAPVPLPASLPLLGVGIASIGFAKRRKIRRSA